MSEKQIERFPEYLRDFAARRSGTYRATAEELKAIDEAEASGVASDEEVAETFRAFNRS